RVDLAISMVAGEGSGDDATASGDDRILMCPEPIGATRFFWCEEGWRLEQCEYEDLGTVRASRTGSGGRNASYEIMEQFHIEATRVGADAILNAQTRMDTQSRTSSGVGSRGASGQESVIGEISGQAIKLADPDCRGIG
ncbi:MAG: hypothetical protein MJB57_08260, partial [Gemmatimonadetes bacterium]|nr:hypothetical protein [Gemmatimonadota bacterium]